MKSPAERGARRGMNRIVAPIYSKVVFLMIAGANFLYLTVFKKAWAFGRLGSSLADKAMAVSGFYPVGRTIGDGGIASSTRGH